MEHIDRKIFLLKTALEGALTEQERQELDLWLNESEEHRKLYERLQQKSLLSAKWKYYSEEDSTKDWQVIQRVLVFRKKSVWMRSMKYAAAISAVLIGAVLFLYREFHIVPSSMTGVVIMDTIRPGYRHAYMELATGERFALGKNGKDWVRNIEKSVIREGEEGLIIEEIDSLDDGKIEIEYGKVVVPRGGEFQLQLADGTKVWMNSESKLEFPLVFTRAERLIRLQGEAYFEVKHDVKRPFRIETTEGEIVVLGTSFNVQQYGHDMRTTLVDGSVALKVEGCDYRLRPGEEAKVYAGKVFIEPLPDVYERIAWKDGKFVFREKRLEEVMSILERWYNVEVVYQNDDVKSLHFTGNILRHSTIEEVLKFLERTRLVGFRITDRKVFVFAQ